MEQKIRKCDFIQRAHANPFTDRNILIPDNPSAINWSHYFENNHKPSFLDLGCGYGRFTIYLANKYPQKNTVGMEIRKQVCEYTSLKLKEYKNAAAINTSGMIFLPNFFENNSLEKIFILFPDPHFKKKKKKARIVGKQMIDVYSYVLKIGGRIYLSTDVEEYYNEMVVCFDSCLDFEKVIDDELTDDILSVSDEATRAGKKTGIVFGAIYQKVK